MRLAATFTVVAASAVLLALAGCRPTAQPPANLTSVPPTSPAAPVGTTSDADHQGRSDGGNGVQFGSQECLSHMRQIGLAVMMLATDNHGVVALTPSTYVDDLNFFIKRRSIFHCPDAPGDEPSYSLNPAIVGINASAVKDPMKTVALYEGKDKKLDFRHGGKASVVFFAGNARQVNPLQARLLRWQP